MKYQLTNTKCLVWGSRTKGQEGQRWSTPVNKVTVKLTNISIQYRIYQSNPIKKKKKSRLNILTSHLANHNMRPVLTNWATTRQGTKGDMAH